jgi:hypothetical protein
MTPTQQQGNKMDSARNLHSTLLLITTAGPSFQMGTKINYRSFGVRFKSVKFKVLENNSAEIGFL